MSSQQKKVKQPLPKWFRITWMIFKYVIVPLLIPVAIFVGFVVGYVYIGEQPEVEVWETSTWRHVFDLIFKF